MECAKCGFYAKRLKIISIQFQRASYSKRGARHAKFSGMGHAAHIFDLEWRVKCAHIIHHRALGDEIYSRNVLYEFTGFVRSLARKVCAAAVYSVRYTLNVDPPFSIFILHSLARSLTRIHSCCCLKKYLPLRLSVRCVSDAVVVATRYHYGRFGFDFARAFCIVAEDTPHYHIVVRKYFASNDGKLCCDPCLRIDVFHKCSAEHKADVLILYFLI